MDSLSTNNFGFSTVSQNREHHFMQPLDQHLSFTTTLPTKTYQNNNDLMLRCSSQLSPFEINDYSLETGKINTKPNQNIFSLIHFSLINFTNFEINHF